MNPRNKYPGFFAALLLGCGLASAAVFPEKPAKQDYFVDGAGVISEADRRSINDIAAKILKEEKIPIFIVTIPSLAASQASDLTIERYTYELFNHWGIGSQQRNFGMLMLVSTGDRKVRIELGAGWDFSHDQSAKEIIDSLIVPHFKTGDYSRGILAGTEGMNALARGLALPRPKVPWWHTMLFIGLAVLVVMVIVNLFKSGRSGWGWALIAGLGVIIFFLLRSAASGSGGGFGGGSSGGGGASGSW